MEAKRGGPSGGPIGSARVLATRKRVTRAYARTLAVSMDFFSVKMTSSWCATSSTDLGRLRMSREKTDGSDMGEWISEVVEVAEAVSLA